MTFQYDDERITAYVFDELDRDERQAFEHEMANSAALAELVDDTRRTVESLATELKDESPRLALSGSQKQSVQAAMNPGTPAQAGRSKRSWLRVGLPVGLAVSLAANIVLLGGIVWREAGNSRDNSPRAVALSADTSDSMDQEHASESSHPTSESDSAPGPNITVGLDQTGAPTADLDLTFQQDEFDPEVPQLGGFDAKSAKEAGFGRLSPPTVKLYNGQQEFQRENQILLGGLKRRTRTYFRDLQRQEPIPETEVAGEGRGPGRAGDRHEPIVDNPFIRVKDQFFSTFSIDVDTASYAKVRMYLLQQGALPRPDAVRIEELVNYFPYEYEAPAEDAADPFVAHMALADCPWNPKHRLARIAIKGKQFADQQRPPSNLVFLLDVSGSMDQPNKLPLLKRGMKMLVDRLGENDRVAMVVYAGAAGLVLESTHGSEKAQILEALERLKAGGSTNGGDGIRLAYQIARDHFISGGVNRVILCTDGDFNVGTTGTDQLVQLAEENAKSNIFLSVLGFGMGNHNDAMLEQISNVGNGNYAFVDSDAEARKVLVEQMEGTLITIAKDVKIQLEFNPTKVAGYRLIGYENRILATEDFNDDTKDAGEIGAGHTVTALYEIVPAAAEGDVLTQRPPIDESRYQQPATLTEAAMSDETLVLKLRYKEPEEDVSKLLSQTVEDTGQRFGEMDSDFQFAAAVASFGMLLRNSPYKGDSNWDAILEIASQAAQDDPGGYRAEFLEMVERAKAIASRGEQ